MSNERGKIDTDYFDRHMNIEHVAELIADKIVIPGDKDRDGNGLFGVLLAKRCLSPEFIDLAVENGFDVNKDGTSDLVGGLLNGIAKIGEDVSFGNSNIDIAKKLITLGVDLEAKDYYGERTALHNSSLDLTRLLIDSGADVNARDKYGCTPFFMDASVEYRRALLNAGADVNACDFEGNNALFNEFNSIEDINFLINECGLNPTQMNNSGLMAHEHLEETLNNCSYVFDEYRIEQAISHLKDVVRDRLLNVINEETPIEQKPTQKRRRM